MLHAVTQLSSYQLYNYDQHYIDNNYNKLILNPFSERERNQPWRFN